MSSIDPSPTEIRSPPWWRFPIVWLVVAGPALVIVAGFATMAIAFARADIVIVEAPPATARAVGHAAPTAPALQARNHAATPAPEPRP